MTNFKLRLAGYLFNSTWLKVLLRWPRRLIIWLYWGGGSFREDEYVKYLAVYVFPKDWSADQFHLAVLSIDKQLHAKVPYRWYTSTTGPQNLVKDDLCREKPKS